MHIVGIERSEETEGEAVAVHTIDVWYSERRDAWVVERLDATGNHVGVSHVCGSRADALDCLAEWLRAYPDSCLGTPIPDEQAIPRQQRAFARRGALREDARLASRSAIRPGSGAAVRDLIKQS